jgi:hypothetical protein
MARGAAVETTHSISEPRTDIASPGPTVMVGVADALAGSSIAADATNATRGNSKARAEIIAGSLRPGVTARKVIGPAPASTYDVPPQRL